MREKMKLICEKINVDFCLSDLKIIGCKRRKISENNSAVIETSS